MGTFLFHSFHLWKPWNHQDKLSAVWIHACRQGALFPLPSPVAWEPRSDSATPTDDIKEEQWGSSIQEESF